MYLRNVEYNVNMHALGTPESIINTIPQTPLKADSSNKVNAKGII
jgi:hypothetical protein